MSAVTKAIGAQNLYSGWVTPSLQQSKGIEGSGFLNLSIYGTFSATVTVQRTFDGGTTILDVVEYTAAAERLIEDHEARIQYRVGVKTGDYTSGTVNVRLAK